MPLDDVRRTEANVWFSAIVTLRGGAHRNVLDEAEEGLDHLALWSVTALTGRSHPAEATRLRAFMDGLAVNALSRPERFPETELRRQVAGYLTNLAGRSHSIDDAGRHPRTLENHEVEGAEL
ncbi:TetR family transcriptional regulator C-terminal domain-containing protein [Arthrobacter sp. TMN-49]